MSFRKERKKKRKEKKKKQNSAVADPECKNMSLRTTKPTNDLCPHINETMEGTL